MLALGRRDRLIERARHELLKRLRRGKALGLFAYELPIICETGLEIGLCDKRVGITLSKGGLRLRNVCAGYFANSEAVANLTQLLG
jgi:hypothetical protein